MLTADDRAALCAQLSAHEGLRLKPYLDTRGHLTIGIGHNLDQGISHAVAEHIFDEDLDFALTAITKALPWIDQLDAVRQRVLIDMAFNLGIEGLLTFRITLRAIQEGRFEDAARGMRRSLWYQQVKTRGETLAKMMETGRDCSAGARCRA